MVNLLPVGIGLGIFASMTGTIGKQLFRFSELQKNAGRLRFAKITMTIGLVLNVLVGPIVDMMSYMFAPQSLIAPLGGLDVVWNTMLAPFTLGEKITPMLFGGVCCIGLGAFGTSFFGNQEDKDLNLALVEEIFVRKTMVVYLGVLLTWILFNIFYLQPHSSAPKGEPWATGHPLRGLSLGMTAGSIAGNMFCVKAFIELVQASSRDGNAEEIWSHWLPYVMLVGAIFFAVSNLVFLTKAMREYEALFMGAVFEGSLIICASVSGIIVFADLEPLKWHQRIIYFVALVSIVLGIVLVAWGSFKPGEFEDEEEEEEDACEEGVVAAEPLAGADSTKPGKPSLCIDVEASQIGSAITGTPTSATSATKNSSTAGRMRIISTDSNRSNNSNRSNRSTGLAKALSKRERVESVQSLATPFAGAAAGFVFGSFKGGPSPSGKKSNNKGDWTTTKSATSEAAKSETPNSAAPEVAKSDEYTI